MSAALKAERSTHGRGPSGDVSLVTLLGQVAERDEAAFERLYDLTNHRVFGLAMRILRDSDAAADASLETYWTLWRSAASFDPARGRPLAWILTVARSRSIDRLRAQKRRLARDEHTLEGDVEDSVSPSPEAASALSERCARLKVALGSLPEGQRIAIETAFFAGLSHGEVADALDEPLGTVKSRIRLGLHSLRRQLVEMGDE